MSTDLIRPAEARDVPALLGLVQELADYEREPDAVEATPELFTAALFPASGAPTAWAHVAEVDGEVVGMALWYLTFSTWLGRPGIWSRGVSSKPPSSPRVHSSSVTSMPASVQPASVPAEP